MLMLRKAVVAMILGSFLLTFPLPVQAAIAPQFDDRANFSEGLAAVKLNGKWGYIDNAGKWAIKPQYTEENGFDELNKAGNLAFIENRAPIKMQGKWGFLSRTGEVAIAPQYDEVQPFSEGLAAVAVNKKWGYVDGSGQMVITPQFDFGGPFKEGIALIMIDKGTATGWSPFIGMTKKARRDYVYVDKTGRVVIAGPYNDVYPSDWQHAIFSGPVPKRSAALVAVKHSSFSEGLAGTRTKAGVPIYIDKQGRQVLEFGKQIAGLFPFQNDRAYLQDENGKILVIDKTGKVIVGPQYREIGAFSSDGLAAAAENKNEYGYVNKSYRYMILPRFAEAGAFFAGMAPVKVDERWRYIDTTGKYVNTLQFEGATDFRADVAFVKLRGKYALIDKQFESITVSAQ